MYKSAALGTVQATIHKAYSERLCYSRYLGIVHAAPYLVVTTHRLPASCVPEEEDRSRPCQPEVLEATEQGTWHQARPHASPMVYVQIRRDIY